MPPKRASSAKAKPTRRVAGVPVAASAAAAPAPKPRAARGRKRTNQDDEEDEHDSTTADATEVADDAATKPKRPVGKKSKKAVASTAGTSESDDPTASEPAASSSAAADGLASSSSAAAGSGAGVRIRSGLDADCLSVVLSFLSTADFLSAIRVNSQWRAARTRRWAFPALSVAPLIRALQDDDYSNSVRRRLAINSPQQLRSLLAHAESMACWKHVTDVRVVQRTAGSTRREAVDNGRLLDQLMAFTAMQALTLDGTTVSAEEIERLYAEIKDRLLALTLFRCAEAFVV